MQSTVLPGASKGSTRDSHVAFPGFAKVLEPTFAWCSRACFSEHGELGPLDIDSRERQAVGVGVRTNRYVRAMKREYLKRSKGNSTAGWKDLRRNRSSDCRF
jgi:hypothetical protein